jgi:uncharacterized membrane-anchored protein
VSENSENGLFFKPHAWRGRVLAEVHARPFVAVDTPTRILHFAFITDHLEAVKARAAFEVFCLEHAAVPPRPDAKHHRIELTPASLRWEHHSEFTTYTWEFPVEGIGDADDGKSTPFRPGADELAGVMRLLPQPGPLLVAIDLHLLPEGSVIDGFKKCFGAEHLVASEVASKAAIIATDFLPDAYGFIRILVLDRCLGAMQTGALLQRLLEIETYRTLALLGLPEAQEVASSIRRIETELPLFMDAMQKSEGLAANRHLLEQLTALASELEAGAAKSLYRFGATRAYYELLNNRLNVIGEEPLPNLPTFASFLARRLTPAIRTCTSTEARQDNLSRKLARAAQLLRTRVEIDLESQNGDLLRKMNHRARLQLQLQQTVEGLSIAAITYYIASIMHLIFEGVHDQYVQLEPALATALMVPLILFFVAFMLRRIRKRHSDES